MTADIPLDLLNCTVQDLARGLQDGNITSVQLVEAYLGMFHFMTKLTLCIARIEKDNHQGLKLNAIISVAPRHQGGRIPVQLQSYLNSGQVLGVAHQLDDERSNKGSRGMLHGIPVLVK
jgi:amidase